MRKLIESESTSEKGELAVAEAIYAELEGTGAECRVDRWEGDRANFIAEVKSSGERGGLLIACHMDVVGPGEARWANPPFSGVAREGRIYGRGAADMKGGIAAAVGAIKEVIESGVKLKGDIIFVGAAGEETDSCGAERFVRGWSKGRKLAGVVIPEPTDFEVVTAHRGMLWLKVVTKGKAAHGSTPELGVNAIGSMKAVLDELEGYRIDFEPNELLGGCSMSVNTIRGGKEINVVPDECSIGIDIRTLPGQRHEGIISDFEKMLARLRGKNPNFEAEVSIIRGVGALETDGGCDFVKEFCSVVGAKGTKAVGFTTDGPHFAGLGAAVVIFGPGEPGVCHKPDEYIEIADVERAVGYYKDIILRFCG